LLSLYIKIICIPECFKSFCIQSTIASTNSVICCTVLNNYTL
jgi:hypothetical protein